MAVLDHPVHEKTRQKAGARYGCHNRDGFVPYYYAWDRQYRDDGSFSLVQVKIEHRMSTQCRSFYLWGNDLLCKGCVADRDQEYARRMQEHV